MKMIISNIQLDNYLYLNLHAEEVITSCYFNDGIEGVFLKKLQYETLTRVKNFLANKQKTLKEKGVKYLILDFNNLDFAQNNLFDEIIEIRNLGFKLVFLNITHPLWESLSLKAINNVKNQQDENGNFKTFYFFTAKRDTIYSKEINPTDIFYHYFTERLKGHIHPFNKPHSSSFIYLTSFVNIKEFVSKESAFAYYSIYKLALKIKRHWIDKLETKPTLVGQSLTSTFLVSILAQMLGLQILIIDKVGPITKLYQKLEKHNFDKRSYIIISDFVCLGTEVKITKSLIEFSGGNYLGNASLVKVETLSRKHIDLKNIDRTIAVFSINKENNEELNYFIYTDLIPKSNED